MVYWASAHGEDVSGVLELAAFGATGPALLEANCAETSQCPGHLAVWLF